MNHANENIGFTDPLVAPQGCFGFLRFLRLSRFASNVFSKGCWYCLIIHTQPNKQWAERAGDKTKGFHD